jgi:hypothetical protein
MASLISHGDCAGLKRVWQFAKARTGIFQSDRSQYLSMVERRQRRGAVEARHLESAVARSIDVPLVEDAFAGDYDGYFAQFSRPRLVVMTTGQLHGKSWTERLFFYDAIGSHVMLDAGWLSMAADEGGEELFRHIVYRNYHHLAFPEKAVADELLYRHHWPLSQLFLDVLSCMREGKGSTLGTDRGRHDELVEFAYRILAEELSQEVSLAG